MTSPSNSIRPRRVLCEQCSLQVWARVSSSQSVGSRPSSAKWSWIGPHLGEAQVELALLAQVASSASSSMPADRHLDAAEAIGLPLAEPVERQRRRRRPARRRRWPGPCAISRGSASRGPFDPIGPDRPDVLDGEAEVAEEGQGALGLGVGHAGLGQDVDDRALSSPFERCRIRRSWTENDSTTGSTRTASARSVIDPVERPFDQEPPARGDRQGPGRPSSAASAATRRPARSIAPGRGRSGGARA